MEIRILFLILLQMIILVSIVQVSRIEADHLILDIFEHFTMPFLAQKQFNGTLDQTARFDNLHNIYLVCKVLPCHFKLFQSVHLTAAPTPNKRRPKVIEPLVYVQQTCLLKLLYDPLLIASQGWCPFLDLV